MDENKLTCGTCKACCTVMGVKELSKKANVACEHLCDIGCSIYERRPPTCASFQCLYLQGIFGKSDEEFLRPDKLGLMFHIMENTRFAPDQQLLVCYEVWPNSSASEIAQAILEPLASKTLILMLSQNKRWFIGPPDEVARVGQILRETFKGRTPLALLPAPPPS